MSADSREKKNALYATGSEFEVGHDEEGKGLIRIKRVSPIPGELIFHASEIKILQDILQHEASSLR
ncbi:MAG TPA: hypothetical protein VN578_11035 [Candidatus Binatia bacterium]|nr:hypothetical protein [Candidatus Binatia bacterium]